MSLSLPFIQRPIATSLFGVAIALLGILCFNLLPVSPLPQIEFPTISVQAALPGASPEIMATSVTTPLERQLGRMAGVTELTSTSGLGSCNITIQFDLSRDIDGAARDVQSAINSARGQLPSDLPANPTYRKINPADSPIIILALTSNNRTSSQMYDLASSTLQQSLSQIDGVGQVVIGGSSLPAVRIELNPTILNKYGLGLDAVRNFLSASNVSRPKGQLSGQLQSSEIITENQLFKARDYAPLIISYRHGNAIHLGDVADVVDSVEDVRNAGLFNNKPSVLIILFKQPDANIIDTVNNVRQTMPYLQQLLPADMDMDIAMDRTATIRASLHDVELTLLMAIVLVLLIVYVFLGNIRAAFIPSLVVPLSLAGTFGVMYLLDFSLNNLSLMALTIATGFVVDDAVVVVENVIRYTEKGLTPLQAAIKGVHEVGFTVVSMSVSLIAVFIPILLMEGIIGRLFREFAISLSVAIIMSLIISLTITPMMCAKLLSSQPTTVARTPSLSDRIVAYYRLMLGWSLNHTNLVFSIMIATIILNIGLFIMMPKSFFPLQDTGRIAASIQAQQNISFQAMQKKMSVFCKIISDDPAVATVSGYTGGSRSALNSGTVFIMLKPLGRGVGERSDSADVVINRLRPKLAQVPGATALLRSSQDLVIGGRSGNAQYQYTLSAYDLNELNRWTPKIMAVMAQIPGIIDLNSDQMNQGLQTMVDIDRYTVARLNLTPKIVDNALYDAFGQRQVSTLYTPLNQYHVVMEVAPQFWQNPATLQSIYVPTSQGKLVPLGAVSTFSSHSSLLAVNHQSQLPSATLSFNLLPGTSIGEAVNQIQNTFNNMQVPGSIVGNFQGTAKAFQSSLAREPWLILAALISVYIILGMLYESLLHPLIILTTLPSAGIGAIMALRLTGFPLDIMGLIGIILLIGIVKKNAIMMIDFAIQLERDQHKTAPQAIFEACLLRFRPIMMTTAAAMLSALPLVISHGIGAELRQPLGITIIGGLMISQLLTLFTTPVVYLKIAGMSSWWRSRRK